MPQAPPSRDRDARFGVLAGLAVAGFGLVVLGLLRLQVLQHDELSRLSEQNRVRLDVIRAPRGAIRDRYGRLHGTADDPAAALLLALAAAFPC